jgi:phenylalanine-4-hydroxylase
MCDLHRRIVELHKVQVTERADSDFGVEACPGLWPTIVFHDLFAGHAMPIIEAVTRMYLPG